MAPIKQTYHLDGSDLGVYVTGMSANVVPLRALNPQATQAPTAADLVERVQRLATDTLNVRMDHPHLQQQMVRRGLSMVHVLETMRKGRPTHAPTLDKYGDWRIKIERLVAGKRVQVVVAVKEGHVVVITAI